MNQNLQPGLHPDADQLSIFVEGGATARERERMLAHLAECEECRDTVFLMRGPEETPDAQQSERPEWILRRWFLPAGLAAAALACGVTVILVRVSTHNGAGGTDQIASVQKPQTKEKTTAPVGSPAPAAQPEKPTSGPRQGAAVTHTVRREAGGPAGSNALTTEKFPEAAHANSQRVGSALLSNSSAEKAEISPAPTPSTQPSVNSAEVQELPLNGRNVTNLQSLARGAQAATPQDRSEAQQSLPVLRVERPSGQNDMLSGVSGRVTDASGAVIPKATVALRDGSGSMRQTATGADGSFQLTGIPAGRYELTVTAPGFKSNHQSIDLKPSELAMLQPQLAVGAATETVTVTSATPVFETESASVASIITELPSRLPVASSVSLGKRILSMDDAGDLFLSHNAGKSWKKVHPQWAGKPVSIVLKTAESKEAEGTSEISSAKNPKNVFQLTTDTGAKWTSKDGMHWRPQ